MQSQYGAFPGLETMDEARRGYKARGLLLWRERRERMLSGLGSRINRACLGQEIVKCCAGRRGGQNSLWHFFLFLPWSSVSFPSDP